MVKRISVVLIAVLMAISFAINIPMPVQSDDNIMLVGVSGHGTGTNAYPNYVEIMRFRAVASGVANEIHVFGGRSMSNTKVALYSDYIGSPRNLLASTTGTLLPDVDNAFSISDVEVVQGQYYWVATIGESYNCANYNTSGTGGTRRYKYAPYSTYAFPQVWNNNGFIQDNFIIYAGIYTAGEVVIETTNTVVCLGDSVTYGYPTGGTTAYPFVLQQWIPSYTVLNKGVNGLRTDQMLARFQSDVIANSPEYVAIWGGENDIAQSLVEDNIDWVTSSLSSMYATAKSAGIKVIALTVIPMKGWVGYTDLRGQRINEINTWIKAQENVDYIIDVYSLVDNGSGQMQQQYAYGDYAHLSVLGYELVGNTMYNHVWLGQEIPIPSFSIYTGSVELVSPQGLTVVYSDCSSGSFNQTTNKWTVTGGGTLTMKVINATSNDYTITATVSPSGSWNPSSFLVTSNTIKDFVLTVSGVQSTNLAISFTAIKN